MHFFDFFKMKGLEMIKCKSLRINMLPITHTGKSVNFPVTGANFVTFLSNLGLFKAKSRSNLSVMNN